MRACGGAVDASQSQLRFPLRDQMGHDLVPYPADRPTAEPQIDNGAKWRSIPAELGDWHHAYLRFRRWAVRGVWDKIMAHLVAQGEPQLALACVDGTIARAHQKASGARPGKDRC